MYYLYFISNFGIPTLAEKSNSKEKIAESAKKEMSGLDPDTNRYLIISSKEMPVYHVKGMNEE